MPRPHNAIVYHTSLQRGLARAAGMSEEEEGVSRLSESLYPVLDAWGAPEFSHLRGERLLWGRTGPIAAGVAQRSMAQVYNPADSRALVIIEAVRTSILGSDWEVGITEAILSDARDTYRRDGRPIGVGRSLLRVETAATPATTVMGQTMAAGQTEYRHAMVIAPGQGIICQPTADNFAFEASFTWREHPLMPGELQGS